VAGTWRDVYDAPTAPASASASAAYLDVSAAAAVAPTPPLGCPWYAALGDHDWRGDVAGAAAAQRAGPLAQRRLQR
jgi:hypothetical protein